MVCRAKEVVRFIFECSRAMEESVAQLEPGKTENRDEALVRGKQLMRGNSLVVRFCMYGFLKNLKFFEPFLVAVLLKWNLTLTTVGALISVEKVTCYVMEIPSGYLSDRWGARKTLCSCFVLYIISFVLYYFGQVNTAVLVCASFFYGLAEAMRSGAHKAMVFKWLERHDLLPLKSFLNGKTRSFSLLGSATAAIGGIFLKIYLEADKTIFLCSIPPYLIDLLVVASYPAYMDEGKTSGAKKKKSKARGICNDARALLTVLKKPGPRRALAASAAVGIMHRLFKDFIQPLVLQNGPILAATFGDIPVSNSSATVQGGEGDGSVPETVEAVILGSFYCLFYLFAAPATRNAYRLPQLLCPKGTTELEKRTMDGLLDAYSLVLLLVGLFLVLSAPVAGPILYIPVYVIYNFHKPLSHAAISDVAGKDLRATVFSANAALETLMVGILAPLLGFLADQLSLSTAFFVFPAVSIVLNRIFFAEWSLSTKR